ncbi:uncharacterized protein LOC108235868 [Kryptolebias marmoratus]|uniref:uncharacterized protein LOC108235868 n=1 Tax=Kryptolebias marmoratus TaxID=37003 RepID=UPI0007F8F7F0|nr:uncharacterized protein LOC108235868 [Kryptolebias marmoratus]
MGRAACSQARMMKAHWWSCVLGLFCIPAVVSVSLVSQSPSSIPYARPNSSVQITCTISQLKPLGLSLHRYFHNKTIVYLSFENGLNKKTTLDVTMKNRTAITPSQQGQSLEFTIKLSLLKLDDTDLYYCRWIYFNINEVISLESNGTIVIVRESVPQDQCKGHTVDFALIALSGVALVFTLFFFIGALVVNCRRFKKQFTPAISPRPPRPPRPDRPHHINHPRQTHQRCSYLITSTDIYGFRSIG